MPDIQATPILAPIPVAAAAVQVSIVSVDDVIGSASQELTFRVLSSATGPSLPMAAGDVRPLRFEILGISGDPAPTVLITSVVAQMRRSSDPSSAAVSITPVLEDHVDEDGLTYSWRMDVSTIRSPGAWVLEWDVVMLNGVEVRWPSVDVVHLLVVEGVA